MKSIYQFTLIALLLILIHSPVSSQSNDFKQSVPVWVTFPNNSGDIQLNWTPDQNATGYTIYRKAKDSNSWGLARANLPGTDSVWIDDSAQPERAYEYRIQRSAGSYSGAGYILAGREVPAEALPGKLLLLVDDRFGLSLAPEIDRYVDDLVREGWSVQTRYVSKDTTVTYVKSLIESNYDDAPSQMRAVFLLGHIPVPYSGEIAPDGHSNHVGAWASDGYYAEMNGFWTDFSVNNTTASRPVNQNTPGDGKFDQSSFPSQVELEIGRVDFYDMPAFTETEEELLRRYLNKNHAFRQGGINLQRRALIENNFAGFAEGFGQNGLKNFTPMFGPDKVSYQDFRSTLQNNAYLCSYGCGAGSYTSCGGVTNTGNYTTDSLQTIFTMLFGSYFGDWDSPNNLLRASLASGLTLTNLWAGRPNYTIHQMALGETIGYGVRRSMNNLSTYTAGFGPTGVHMALMGDPTLRLLPHIPMEQLTALAENDQVTLEWEETDSNAIAYMIFRLDEGDNAFHLLVPDMLKQTTYVDSCLDIGLYQYMVRAVYLDSTASGTFYSLGPGIIESASVNSIPLPEASFNTILSQDTLILSNTSINSTSYFWDFGDGNTSTEIAPTHVYGSAGEYTIILIASNSCYSDTLSFDITVDQSTSIPGFEHSPISLSPNPASDIIRISLPASWVDVSLAFSNSNGQTILQRDQVNGGRIEVSVTDWPAGIYFVHALTGTKIIHRAFVIHR